MRPSLTFSRGLFFIYRDISYNKITGMIPSQMSALVKLGTLYVLTCFIFNVKIRHCSILVLMSVGLVRLSLTFSKFFFSQHSQRQWLDGPNPV